MRIIFLLSTRGQLRLGLALSIAGNALFVAGRRSVDRAAVNLKRVRTDNVRTYWTLLFAMLLAVSVPLFCTA